MICEETRGIKTHFYNTTQGDVNVMMTDSIYEISSSEQLQVKL